MKSEGCGTRKEAGVKTWGDIANITTDYFSELFTTSSPTKVVEVAEIV